MTPAQLIDRCAASGVQLWRVGAEGIGYDIPADLAPAVVDRLLSALATAKPRVLPLLPPTAGAVGDWSAEHGCRVWPAGRGGVSREMYLHPDGGWRYWPPGRLDLADGLRQQARERRREMAVHNGQAPET